MYDNHKICTCKGKKTCEKNQHQRKIQNLHLESKFEKNQVVKKSKPAPKKKPLKKTKSNATKSEQKRKPGPIIRYALFSCFSLYAARLLYPCSFASRL